MAKATRKLTESENLNLPIPRLEIRYRKPNKRELRHRGWMGVSVIADYSLVYDHLMGDVLAVSMGSTKIGGGHSEEPGYLELPFRDGAHVMNDMWTLKLPAFVINGSKFEEIKLTPESTPNGLFSKMRGEKTLRFKKERHE